MRDGASSSTGYRQRAERFRAEAVSMSSPATKQILLKIASDYEKRAAELEAMHADQGVGTLVSTRLWLLRGFYNVGIRSGG
jgi:hypothetical protein